MKKIETTKLELLRAVFLEKRIGAAPQYWDDVQTLELYDATFARRIAWKWDAVWGELLSLGWSPLEGITTVLDWGCGSGVASESLLQHLPAAKELGFVLFDRSKIATAFSAKKLSEHFGVKNILQNVPVENFKKTLLLVSHVLTELDDRSLSLLVEMAQNYAAVVWVEPGTPFCSQHLIQIREKLRLQKCIVAPCLHQETCGLLSRENSADWCHFFANSPQEVFHEAKWSQFARTVGIDLRSLPVSFLVAASDATSAKGCFVAGLARVLGKPRLQKGCARVCACRSSGVASETLQKKDYKEFLSELSSGVFRAVYAEKLKKT